MSEQDKKRLLDSMDPSRRDIMKGLLAAGAVVAIPATSLANHDPEDPHPTGKRRAKKKSAGKKR